MELLYSFGIHSLPAVLQILSVHVISLVDWTLLTTPILPPFTRPTIFKISKSFVPTPARVPEKIKPGFGTFVELQRQKLALLTKFWMS